MAKTVIAISFTLKGQSLESIREALAEIAAAHEGEDVLMVHGNLPREVVIERKLPTDLCDMLDELFPNQANFYSPTMKKVERENMANYLSEVGGKAYIVGFVKDGVKEEVDLYREVIGEDNIQFVATDELRSARDHAENVASDIAEGKDLRQNPLTENESFKVAKNGDDLPPPDKNIGLPTNEKPENASEDLKSFTQDEVGTIPETSGEKRVGGFHEKSEPVTKKKSSKKKQEEEGKE